MYHRLYYLKEDIAFHEWKILTLDLSMGSQAFWLILHNIGAFLLNKYRISHFKLSKVIWLCWRYRFWFLPIFWFLCVHEKDTFMLNSSDFIFLMLRTLYGSITQNLLFLNKFWIFMWNLVRRDYGKWCIIILLAETWGFCKS